MAKVLPQSGAIYHAGGAAELVADLLRQSENSTWVWLEFWRVREGDDELPPSTVVEEHRDDAVQVLAVQCDADTLLVRGLLLDNDAVVYAVTDQPYMDARRFSTKPGLTMTEVTLNDTHRLRVFDDWTDPSWLEHPKHNSMRYNSGYPLYECVRPFDQPERRAYFGDGGEVAVVFPIWYTPQLPVSAPVRAQLVKSLAALAEERRDKQHGRPVEDIIDPDLRPLRVPRPTIAQLAREMGGHGDEERVCDDSVDVEAVRTRRSYHWLASEFEVSPGDNVEIKCPIQNLLRTAANEPLYAAFAEVFKLMVPMFRQVGVVPTDPKATTSLQVVVKAQRYVMPPGTSYAGRWHTEGATENVVAAGVYYADVGPELTGGTIRYRLSSGPNYSYAGYMEQPPPDHVEVPTAPGTAVVFNNCLPHRFRKIYNRSDKEQQRLFINFFVIDPSRPITTTAQAEGNPAAAWGSLEEAKEYRETARAAMLRMRSGWGDVNWGNCGVFQFVEAYDLWPGTFDLPPERLQHTESPG